VGKLSRVAQTVLRSGIGLHGGRPATVELVREAGPVRVERDGAVRPLDAFRVAGGRFSTTIACDAFELGMVEHLFSALAGLGVRDGLRVRVTGDELPLLDGGARAFVALVRELGIAPRPAALRVARAATLEVDGATYSFEPGARTRVEVAVDLPPCCAAGAAWDGDEASFVERIAGARTFALARDMGDLERLGLARHASPESVVVVADDALYGAGVVAPDEPARHKLLDLVGDAYLHGGPPLGTLRARRPGHARNHAAFARALETGVLVKGSS
jgi:UDP-3-O-[3-hydroxymyristoyl] N-acetylglucosamine deacetylase